MISVVIKSVIWSSCTWIFSNCVSRQVVCGYKNDQEPLNYTLLQCQPVK